VIAGPQSADMTIAAALARTFDASPVALAVTEGPAHAILYANVAFQRLRSVGEITIGAAAADRAPTTTDIATVLDRALRDGATIRDEPVAPLGGGAARWTCTVWPIRGDVAAPSGLVTEIRDAAADEDVRLRQRAVTERLLLGALREQDAAHRAVEMADRAAFLAAASRKLAMVLDQHAIREIVRRCALPREGSWCMVDVVDRSGAIHRLTVAHPDPAQQRLAHRLEGDAAPPEPGHPAAPHAIPPAGGEPVVITEDSGASLVAAAHGAEQLAVLRELGFGALLVVPLVVRGTVLGAMTFVTRAGDAPLSAAEIALASDLADRCAIALDNARLYAEAEALRATAETANQAKSEFLGHMSHELMTPLNAIGGYVDLLEMGLRGPVTLPQRDDLARIKRNQRHLIALISRILEHAHAESGKIQYHLADVPVGFLLHEVAEMLEGAATQKHVVLDVHPAGLDSIVRADPDRVRQVLVNLVTNAVKHGTPGGGHIAIGCAVAHDTVHVYVADAGPGIPADKLTAIFEPFTQLATGLSDRRGGVGLGLAISRDLARSMHGDLAVESTVGVGSRFTLILPRGRTSGPTG
jgi:signal transduction histidine kinase